MRLHSLRIENFRSFKDQTITFSDYSCFVGPNGAGKSTILSALNIIFKNQSTSLNVNNLSEEDFFQKDTNNDIKLTITFSALSQEAEESLKEYVRHHLLTFSVKATWDANCGRAEAKQYGQRLCIEDFSQYFDFLKIGAKAPELKATYFKIREKYPDLPDVSIKAEMESALRKYESERPDLCSLKESEDQFYGFSKGVGRIQKFCQWVYIPAVKDASEEQFENRNTALAGC